MGDSPKRIQRQRTKGWRMPEGAVYVGRGSAFGNPWSIAFAMAWFELSRDQARGRVVDWYRDWLHGPGHADPLHESGTGGHAKEHASIHADINRLRGKDLACWCPLDHPCHADVLLELANRPTPPGSE